MNGTCYAAILEPEIVGTRRAEYHEILKDAVRGMGLKTLPSVLYVARRGDAYAHVRRLRRTESKVRVCVIGSDALYEECLDASAFDPCVELTRLSLRKGRHTSNKIVMMRDIAGLFRAAPEAVSVMRVGSRVTAGTCYAGAGAEIRAGGLFYSAASLFAQKPELTVFADGTHLKCRSLKLTLGEGAVCVSVSPGFRAKRVEIYSDGLFPVLTTRGRFYVPDIKISAAADAVRIVKKAKHADR